MKNQIQLLSNTRSKSGKFAASRRILVVRHGTLLDEGVVNLLAHKPDLEIWGVDKDNDAAVVHAASQIRPAILLLFHTHPDEQKELLLRLDACPNLKRLTIIIVHLNSNNLFVHYKENWFSVGSDAFFPLVHGHSGTLLAGNSWEKSPDKPDRENVPAIRLHDLPGLQRLFFSWGLLPSRRILAISTRKN